MVYLNILKLSLRLFKIGIISQLEIEKRASANLRSFVYVLITREINFNANCYIYDIRNNKMNRLEKNDKQYERSSERERSSDRESNSSKDSYRRSSSRTDDDEYKSISEERGNRNHKTAYDKSRERERYRDDKSRRIRHSSNERNNQSHHKYKKHRERNRSHNIKCHS